MDAIRYCHATTCDRFSMTTTDCQCGFVAYHLAHPEQRATTPKPGTSGVYDGLRHVGASDPTSLHVVRPLTQEQRDSHLRRVGECQLV